MKKQESEGGTEQAKAAATNQQREVGDLVSAVQELTKAIREQGAAPGTGSNRPASPAANAVARTFHGIQSVVGGEQQRSKPAGAKESTR
jgi:hypothetical protein